MEGGRAGSPGVGKGKVSIGRWRVWGEPAWTQGWHLLASGAQVYTVGPDYAHAEARKSPALDGKVERDSEGKEIRYPVMLTAMEKLVARKVCVAFKVGLSLLPSHWGFGFLSVVS